MKLRKLYCAGFLTALAGVLLIAYTSPVINGGFILGGALALTGVLTMTAANHADAKEQP